MSTISDKVLDISRKYLEQKNRKGETVKDFREGKVLGEYIANAEKLGVVSALKSAPAAGGPSYIDGVEAFANSKEFANYAAAKGGNGSTYEWNGKSGLHVPGSSPRGGHGTKAPSLTTVADIRTNLTTERSDQIIRPGVRQIRLRTYCAQIPTTQAAFTAPRETGFVNNAAGRPENVDASSATDAAQSRLSTDWPSVKVETIDHYVDFSKELLDDLPAFVAYMRERGVDGVDDEEDSQITNGAGPASNEFLGILTDPDIPDYAWSDGDVGDNMADAVLGAHVEIISAEYMPDQNLLSILDHALICKMKDLNGNYLFPAAHRQGADEFALWGIPTSKTTALATGVGVSGAFRRAAEYRSRQDIGYRLTDSHEGRFTKGIYTLVIERRAGFWVNRPESFRSITFDNAPA